jgi:hypothetical protein
MTEPANFSGSGKACTRAVFTAALDRGKPEETRYIMSTFKGMHGIDLKVAKTVKVNIDVAKQSKRRMQINQIVISMKKPDRLNRQNR